MKKFLVLSLSVLSTIMVSIGVLAGNWYGVTGWVIASVSSFIFYGILESCSPEKTDWYETEKRINEKYLGKNNDEHLGI